LPIRNIHKKPFDEGTLTKLELYRGYLREWLPTFMNNPGVKVLQIFDFFAGPGSDLDGNPGSPLIALEAAKSALGKNMRFDAPCVDLHFNELNQTKETALRELITQQPIGPSKLTLTVTRMPFKEAFLSLVPRMTGEVANLVFLDQNGIKQVSQDVIERLASLPRTDLLFFVSSALVNRFKRRPEIRGCVPIADADFERMNGGNVHRILADAYRRWLPMTLGYFMASFSIRKGANVYGLVFGTGHPLGIHKFLRVAWKKGGDASFDIDKDGINPLEPKLFAEMNRPSKVREYEIELRNALIYGKLRTNREVFIFGLEHGVLAFHSREAIDRMIKDGELPRQKIHISYEAWAKSGPAEKILLKDNQS